MLRLFGVSRLKFRSWAIVAQIERRRKVLIIALSGAENFADASRSPIPPVAGQRELPPQALTVALTVPSKVKPAFTGKASGAIHRLPMSHAATVITSAAKKQNQYYNDQNQFHDKLQCAGFE
jgi:hypothetical protein